MHCRPRVPSSLAVTVVTVGCAPRPVPVAAPRIAPEVLAARLAEADRLASRGCYLCLKEAAAAYASLLTESDDGRVLVRALENNLMLAMREIELRIPDSGARETAEQLQVRVPASYAAYFAALDLQANPLVVGGVPVQTFRAQYEERLKFVAGLETDAAASVMKTYFFIAHAIQLREFKELKTILPGLLEAHPDDLSLKYQMLAYQPMYSADGARNLIGQETGFGEVHLLIGQRAVLSGDIAAAYRELTRARELLPDSVSVALALANATFSYARYADALALFDRILASPASHGVEMQVRLGRAKSLSYLKRHDEAIAQLIELLQNDPSNNPGEKYYWRAWNQLQLGRAQLAYDDAIAGPERDAQRRDLPPRGHGVVQPESPRRITRLFRARARDEPCRLRFAALSWPARFRGTQLDACIGPLYARGVVLRRRDCPDAEAARRIRERHHRSVERPHRRQTPRDQRGRRSA